MTTFGKRLIVLCEGKDDASVLANLATHLGIGDLLEFRDYEGRNRLRDYLRLVKVSPEYTSGHTEKILVTRDADATPKAAWTSTQGAVRDELGVSVDEPGVWEKMPSGTAVAIWIIPARDQEGMIETLCMRAAENGDVGAFACVDALMGCLERLHGQRPHEKLRFALWTMCRKAGSRDRLSLRAAIAETPVDWDDPTFAALSTILKDMASGQQSI